MGKLWSWCQDLERTVDVVQGFRGRDAAQLVEHCTGTPLTQVQFPSVARDFSHRVNIYCMLSYGVRTPQQAIACIIICVRVKDPAVLVRVQWIMETLKHPACTVTQVTRLCCSCLSPGKAIQISQWRNLNGMIQLLKTTTAKNKTKTHPNHGWKSLKLNHSHLNTIHSCMQGDSST